MRKEEILMINNLLVRMKGLADNLEIAQRKKDSEKISNIKERLLELQRSIKRLI